MLPKAGRCVYAAAVTACLMTTNARADEEIGPGRLQGNLSTLLTYSNNFYYQPTATQSVTGLLLRPALKYHAETGQAALDLKGNVEYATFTAPGSKDDYFDRTFGTDLAWTPTYRNRFLIDGSLTHGHDPFGTARTEGSTSFNTDLDQWNRKEGGGRYRYGAPGARVNAEVGVTVVDVNYTTNEAATRFLDYKNTTAEYSLFYNYSPKTALLLSFDRTGVEFDTPFANTLGPGGTTLDTRGGNLYQVRGGIRWLATAKTSGDVRAGYRQRTFDNLPQSVEGFDWQAAVQWSPTTPLLLELKTVRSEDQSYRGDTNVLDVKATSFSLKRTVNQRSLFIFGLNDARTSFFGSGRDDETRGASIGLEIAAQSSVFVIANIGYAMRDSTDPNLDYHRLGGFVGLRLGRPG